MQKELVNQPGKSLSSAPSGGGGSGAKTKPSKLLPMQLGKHQQHQPSKSNHIDVKPTISALAQASAATQPLANAASQSESRSPSLVGAASENNSPLTEISAAISAAVEASSSSSSTSHRRLNDVKPNLSDLNGGGSGGREFPGDNTESTAQQQVPSEPSEEPLENDLLNDGGGNGDESFEDDLIECLACGEIFDREEDRTQHVCPDAAGQSPEAPMTRQQTDVTDLPSSRNNETSKKTVETQPNFQQQNQQHRPAPAAVSLPTSSKVATPRGRSLEANTAPVTQSDVRNLPRKSLLKQQPVVKLFECALCDAQLKDNTSSYQEHLDGVHKVSGRKVASLIEWSVNGRPSNPGGGGKSMSSHAAATQTDPEVQPRARAEPTPPAPASTHSRQTTPGPTMTTTASKPTAATASKPTAAKPTTSTQKASNESRMSSANHLL